MRELGRRGGQARAKKAEPQDRGERLRELAWQALEELLASDTAPTAKVKAATELLDRLEPLLKRDQAEMRKQVAAEFEAVTASARAKLDRMLASRIEARRMTPKQFEQWLEEAGRALVELERVIVSDNPKQPIVRYAEPRMDSRRILRGLVELGLIVPPPDWKEFPGRVEERARQLSADAERRAAEAEAKLAEFELERK
jgi:truncated hemoglobin YjbI